MAKNIVTRLTLFSLKVLSWRKRGERPNGGEREKKKGCSAE
jgi:hypothetical protein